MFNLKRLPLQVNVTFGSNESVSFAASPIEADDHMPATSTKAVIRFSPGSAMRHIRIPPAAGES